MPVLLSIAILSPLRVQISKYDQNSQENGRNLPPSQADLRVLVPPIEMYTFQVIDPGTERPQWEDRTQIGKSPLDDRAEADLILPDVWSVPEWIKIR